VAVFDAPGPRQHFTAPFVLLAFANPYRAQVDQIRCIRANVLSQESRQALVAGAFEVDNTCRA
jgi:hypothetical protein